MDKSLTKRVLSLLLAALLLLSMTTVAGAEGLQQWDLDSKTTTPGYEMEKTTGPGNDGQSGNVSIGAGNSAIWIADQAALVDVTFSGAGEGWIVMICTEDDWGDKGDKCDVSIGAWNSTSGFNPFSTTPGGTVVWQTDTTYILKVTLQSANTTVLKDDWLALKITNNDDSSHDINTNGCSYLQSPCTDPGYPTPELATGILFGIGLLGLVSYLRFKRNKEMKVA